MFYKYFSIVLHAFLDFQEEELVATPKFVSQAKVSFDAELCSMLLDFFDLEVLLVDNLKP